MLANNIGVATYKGDTFSWRNGIPDRYIFFVFGFSSISIDVENSTGKATMSHEGYYDAILQNDWYTHNRVMTLNTLQQQSITVRGKGCYLFVAGTLGDRY
jgi:hypothetical protein